MRNAIKVQDLIVTIDNSGCIGDKKQDLVQVPNEITAYFTARTAILEQWCAGAMPVQLLMANFSGDVVWGQYVAGIQRVFDEIGIAMPPLTGSSESNFDALQSAISLTMIGKKVFSSTKENCLFFVVGQPLVGNEVIKNPEKVAQLKELYEGLKDGWISAIWPTGSKGIGNEIQRFVGEGYTSAINLTTTAGPSCAVLVAVDEQNVQEFSERISAPIVKITKNK
ncbi:hypothetical protein DCE79_05280 [Lysinibacillus sp. 2017]|uniref:hypothetical protein n=1 Tax=unclassified Lysinibacillus TaxID=2636778 RepID=UPI000D52913F|nr:MULTISPECIES: hypothetical protein [unclassified Lysinibacillus]AWE06844.1 hypothetical protein DCE79_05280 [Lysinibacillus sp. 2017]TGN37225.1 hypothetical protein E4L99_01715 [Lysinibacillus sp. S2017]